MFPYHHHVRRTGARPRSRLGAAQDRFQSGSLTCDVFGGHRLISRSATQRELARSRHRCRAVEYYTGTISKLGVDLGVTAGGVMVWLVFARPAVRSARWRGTIVAGPRRPR